MLKLSTGLQRNIVDTANYEEYSFFLIFFSFCSPHLLIHLISYFKGTCVNFRNENQSV